MIPAEILQRKSLFALLYQIDSDLAEAPVPSHALLRGASFITPATSVSLGEAPLDIPEAYAVRFSLWLRPARGVDAEVLPASVLFWGGGFTGRRYSWLVSALRQGRAKAIRCAVAALFGSPGRRWPAGSATFESSFLRAKASVGSAGA